MKVENLTGNPLPDQNKRLTHEARKWVAQTFFGTMLKQMRNSPFKSDLFAGGRGGEAFGTLLDQQLAERMSTGAGSKLVGSIVKGIEVKNQKAQDARQQLKRNNVVGTTTDHRA